MTIAKKFRTQEVLPFVAFALLAGVSNQAFAEGAATIPLEQSQNINGINAMCTGVGIDARQAAMHNGYALRVEIAGKDGQYLGNSMVEISGGGLAAPIAVACKGPWVMFDVPDGSYSVTTTADGGASKTARVNVGGAHQDRLVMRFPNMGGAVSPQHMPQQMASAQ